MTYEEKILAKNSTSNLRRNVLPRPAKKLNMEFDAQYNTMTKIERDAFLDRLYPETKEKPDEPGSTPVIRTNPDGNSDGAEETAPQAGEAITVDQKQEIYEVSEAGE